MAVVETILLILAIILLFLLFIILILLFVPLGIVVSYHGDFNELLLKIRVGFLHVKLNLPAKKLEKDAEEETQKAAESVEETIKKEPVKEIKKNIEKYLPLIKLIPPAIYRLIEKIKIDNVVVVWHVYSKTAADSAINSGKLYSLFYSIFATITPPFNIKLKQVVFQPDFIGDAAINNYINIRVSTQLVLIIIVALWFLIEMKNSMKSNKKRVKIVRKERNTI